ncbi:hypothetical protein K402DRAFT_91099 [Aulographum hederae CBS 113979]|uniref:Uncharacterized protein n=1 Tax=Aulographum hederae CBS 113979 TaxID=1176131 RepID=A0A6G1GZC8_9PEZI|nr:hypothetical protein K402DRAFT_91099 [Aulographum hederae CBS 113979]
MYQEAIRHAGRQDAQRLGEPPSLNRAIRPLRPNALALPTRPHRAPADGNPRPEPKREPHEHRIHNRTSQTPTPSIATNIWRQWVLKTLFQFILAAGLHRRLGALGTGCLLEKSLGVADPVQYVELDGSKYDVKLPGRLRCGGCEEGDEGDTYSGEECG